MGTPDTDASRMPITAHLEELRRRILRSSIAVGVAFAATFSYSAEIIDWLKFPLNHKTIVLTRYPFIQFEALEDGIKLTAIAVTEIFWMHMKVAFFAGIFLAIPYIMTQVWLFISPGLLPRERRYALPFVMSASFMFVAGAAFCMFLVLPVALNFLLNYDTSVEVEITITSYVNFVTLLMLSFGVVFQMPLVISLLARLGIVSPAFLRRNRKYAVLIEVIVAAVITPTTDAFSLMMMALPMLFLYEVGIVLAVFMVKKPAEAEEPTDIQPAG